MLSNSLKTKIEPINTDLTIPQSRPSFGYDKYTTVQKDSKLYSNYQNFIQTSELSSLTLRNVINAALCV